MTNSNLEFLKLVLALSTLLGNQRICLLNELVILVKSVFNFLVLNWKIYAETESQVY